jgi:DNA helicase-2/ATP-dependent DNA helicase PcrA
LDFKESAELIKKVRGGSLSEIEKRLPVISNLRKEISKTGVLEFLALAASESGLDILSSRDPLSAEVWRSIFELAKSLAEAETLEDPRRLVESLLNYKKTAERKVLKIKSGKAFSQITIMTAHGAKGLEFDFVFVPFSTEESWMTKNRGSYFVLPREKGSEDDVKDERRLFYVSLTRAREDLFISFARENSTGSSLSPLRFVEELDEKNIEKIELGEEKMQKAKRGLDKEKQKEIVEKLEYAKITLLENGLSVTALNHFLTCPSQFFYKSILKLPEPPSATSEKGNAMHEAISNVWRAHSPTPQPPPQRVGGVGKNTGSFSPLLGRGVRGEVEKIIINSVQQYFRHSLINKTEKEVILEELIANAPKVATALTDHFNKSGKVLTESWVDTFYKWKFGDQNIEIKLHGKMDAIVENENNIEVFDYKTKEGMSVNEIKGETKNSTGDYFRQLIFYKLLLSENSRYQNKKVEPSLVFVKPDSKGRCPIISLPIQESDIERVKNEISSLLDSIWSGSLLTTSCSEKDCKYCALQTNL